MLPRRDSTSTAYAAMIALDRLWATSGPRPVHRNPGQAGVKARLYVDVRRRPSPDRAPQHRAGDLRLS
ncbi:DUF6207 family protein [Streptomyces sp. NPDC101062]|uniref:DUF6207 family protein n=1 Tax=unclassified Streptomyces TaxID=2593676 RepID=UPI00381FD392